MSPTPSPQNIPDMYNNLIPIIEFSVTIILGFISGLAGVAISLGKYKEKVDQMEKCDLNTRLSKLEGKFEERKDISAFLQTKSPVSLTDKGNSLLAESGGKQYIDTHLERLITDIQEKTPKTAYDVQEFSKAAIVAQTDRDDFSPLKEYIYKEGISLDVLTAVMSIYLRDRALERLNYHVEDIDSNR